MHDDIALIKIQGSFSFSRTVQPVCLPSRGQEWGSRQSFLVSGWGSLSSGGSSPDKLMQVTVPKYDQRYCEQDYGANKIWEHVICAGFENGGKDSCQGDSGGPLVARIGGRFTLAGVVSWGYGCAKAGYPGVYTHVSHYIDWANKIMKI